MLGPFAEVLHPSLLGEKKPQYIDVEDLVEQLSVTASMGENS